MDGRMASIDSLQTAASIHLDTILSADEELHDLGNFAFVSIRLPESHWLLVDWVPEYSNSRTRCQYVAVTFLTIQYYTVTHARDANTYTRDAKYVNVLFSALKAYAH